jgi:hypothetical protein
MNAKHFIFQNFILPRFLPIALRPFDMLRGVQTQGVSSSH